VRSNFRRGARSFSRLAILLLELLDRTNATSLLAAQVFLACAGSSTCRSYALGVPQSVPSAGCRLSATAIPLLLVIAKRAMNTRTLPFSTLAGAAFQSRRSFAYLRSPPNRQALARLHHVRSRDREPSKYAVLTATARLGRAF